MKADKLIIRTLAALMCCPAFVACSNDDDDNGGGGLSGTSNLSSYGITDPVVAISEGEGFAGNWEHNSYAMTFTYSNGAMTGGYLYWEDAYITFGSSDIKYSVVEDDETYELSLSNIKRNSAGCITSADIRMVETGYGETYRINGTFAASYEDGNLLKEMSYSTGEDGYASEERLTLTWDDGCITSMTSTETETEDGDTYTETEVYRFVYGNDAVANNGVYVIATTDYMDYYLFYSGLLGKPSAKIPTGTADGQWDVVTDSKGRVTDIGYWRFYYADTYKPSRAPKASVNNVSKSNRISRIFSKMKERRAMSNK